MTGCIAQRNGIYYVRLTYYDINHKRKDIGYYITNNYKILRPPQKL